jgi:hypothetical protein
VRPEQSLASSRPNATATSPAAPSGSVLRFCQVLGFAGPGLRSYPPPRLRGRVGSDWPTPEIDQSAGGRRQPPRPEPRYGSRLRQPCELLHGWAPSALVSAGTRLTGPRIVPAFPRTLARPSVLTSGRALHPRDIRDDGTCPSDGRRATGISRGSPAGGCAQGLLTGTRRGCLAVLGGCAVVRERGSPATRRFSGVLHQRRWSVLSWTHLRVQQRPRLAGYCEMRANRRLGCRPSAGSSGFS